MSVVGLERAQRALADLTVDELHKFAEIVAGALTERTRDPSVGFQMVRVVDYQLKTPAWDDADELETRHTYPAPPPESER